jgi:hypothetical protein
MMSHRRYICYQFVVVHLSYNQHRITAKFNHKNTLIQPLFRQWPNQSLLFDLLPFFYGNVSLESCIASVAYMINAIP